MLKNKKIAAFSLIEVMIAISVFAIGILAVMQMIVRNLSVVDQAKIRTTATILAQEGIELAYNIRDTNYDKGLPRDCIIDPKLYDIPQDELQISEDEVCVSYFGSGIEDDIAYQFARDKDHYIHTKEVNLTHDFITDWENNMLYYFSGDIAGIQMSRYSNQDDQNMGLAEASPYARYIVFQKVQAQDSTLPKDKIVKIESHVLSERAGQTGEIVLESFIANY